MTFPHAGPGELLRLGFGLRFPWGLEAAGGTISEPAWRSKPSWYLVTTDDRMIPPALQREMSEGPYSDTPDFTILGPPPYYVLSEDCSPEELGRTIRSALEASIEESTSGDEYARLADERTFALARLAGVKDRGTFERGARLVNVDVRASGEILVTPSFRKRGYWEPSPEAQWIRLTRPSDVDLGHAAIEAAARSTA